MEAGADREGVDGSVVDSRLATVVAACCVAGSVTAAQTPTPPLFRAEADLVTIEVQVTASRTGEPVPRLARGQFEIRFDGRQRQLRFATLLHQDKGTVVRGLTASQLDPATGASGCIFRELRALDRPHAHYRIGIEATDADRRRVGKVRVKTTVQDLYVVRWTWRSPRDRDGPS